MKSNHKGKSTMKSNYYKGKLTAGKDANPCELCSGIPRAWKQEEEQDRKQEEEMLTKSLRSVLASHLNATDDLLTLFLEQADINITEIKHAASLMSAVNHLKVSIAINNR